jgi:hypothetical protein
MPRWRFHDAVFERLPLLLRSLCARRERGAARYRCRVIIFVSAADILLISPRLFRCFRFSGYFSLSRPGAMPVIDGFFS